MYIDHSITYRDRSLKNLAARHRLKTILSILDDDLDLKDKTYADVGCSNGYLTALISDRFKPTLTCGYDHDQTHLASARANYPKLTFDNIDLNSASHTLRKYDVVTCFEVLEHVGNIQNALDTLLNMTDGILFLTAPIESGWRGAIKFLIKTVLYGYRLNELPTQKYLYMKYFISLLVNRRMGRFRDQRHSWGTHFGFDYREIDDFLKSRGKSYKSLNRGLSRFYLVRCAL